jgi:hypothetical protein
MMENENLSQARKTAYEEYTIDTMAAMIFGSNMIEKARSREEISLKLCKEFKTYSLGLLPPQKYLTVT